jgi:hypothetical protein
MNVDIIIPDNALLKLFGRVCNSMGLDHNSLIAEWLKKLIIANIEKYNTFEYALSGEAKVRAREILAEVTKQKGLGFTPKDLSPSIISSMNY